MKKNTKNFVLTAALLVSQGSVNMVNAQPGKKQEDAQKVGSSKKQNHYFKISPGKFVQQKMSMVAILKGQPVFRSSTGELFRLNEITGDIITVRKEEFEKMASCGEKLGETYGKGYKIKTATKENSIKSGKVDLHIKLQNALANIKILGVDKDGHVIQETEKGEKFFLDPVTGDMVDYVGHIAFLK